MKPLAFTVSLLLLLPIIAPTLPAEAQPTQNGDQDFVDRSNAYAATLFVLAGEKFTANKKRGEKCIFTIHDSLDEEKVLRYTDGEFIIISIPFFLPNIEGYCNFITHYNGFNLHEADSVAAKGNYAEARKWYQLLLHFDVCGSRQGELRLRMSILDRIEKNEDVESAKKEIATLASEKPSLVLVGLDSEPIKKVPNLLDLAAEKVERPSAPGAK
jgi:hypothetical protein